MKYKVILFDADDTLFDFHKSEAEAFKNTMLGCGVDFDESYHYANYKEINKAIWEEFDKGLITQETLKIERFNRFLTKMQMNYDASLFASTYMNHLSKSSHLFTGAEDLIKELSTDFIIAIVTNGLTVVQEGRIKNSIIATHFKDIVVSEDIGISKPNIEFFEYTMNKLGEFNKDEILMVGDSLLSDIQGGINYGIDTCWYNPYHKENITDIKPTYEISDYDSLRKIVYK